MIHYSEIEEKWQKAWTDAKIFEGELNSKKPYMITAAFPYPNSPQHIGHLRTYGTADTLARYKRMCGYNVLFPMAFHATGTPVLAFAKRIKNNDKDLIKEMKIFHIPDADIEKMTDPLFIANYFIKEIEGGMKKEGLSIDWRRKFISIDPFFSKFIEWQFGILNSKGYLTKGKHPVGWCPNENNPVGMHDTKRDVEPEIDKMTVINFKVEELNAYAPCATFRPETVFGVTNIFVNENAGYVICRIDDGNEQYILSKVSAVQLGYQMKVDVVKEIQGKELLNKKCTNPVNGSSIPILPGFFVQERIGTGVVMSVPAHAPYDYAALEKLRASGYDLDGIKPIKVLEVEIGKTLSTNEVKAKPSQKEIPALAYLETLGAAGNFSDDILELATKAEYREESHFGKMIIEGYAGMGEQEARKKVKEMLEAKKMAFEIYTLTNETEVLCRCGYAVVVKVVDNQWFINYGNKEWKEQVKTAFKDVAILPEQTRNAMAAAIDWIDLRAVARAQGLGTRFPLDKDKIIESLSDSTMYMAFYTVSDHIRNVEVEKLRPEFFDYVFLGKGDTESVSRSTGIDYDIVKRSRESFDYWYNETSRHSGLDLIFNHLTMYLYNHVAVFPKERWPKQIVVNGLVLSGGEKMSKSLGNITPLSDAIMKHGADPLRAVVVAGADLMSDADYSEEAVKGVKERFSYLYNLCENIEEYESGELRQIDYWLYSMLNRKIIDVKASLEKLELRDAVTKILYNSVIELKHYVSRGGDNGMVLKDYISSVVLMLQPISPHISEELWHMLGNTDFASMEKWPSSDEQMISEKAELEEETLGKTIEDAKQVMEFMKKKNNKSPKAIRIIVAEDWKRELYNYFAESRDFNKAMERAKEIKEVKMEKAAAYLTSLQKKAGSLGKMEIMQEDEYKTYEEAKDYIGEMLGVEIEIEKESKSRSGRAERAAPLKPSIDLIN